MYIHSLAILATVGPKVLSGLGYQSILLLYLGPETIMPLASVLGAVVGFLLIFWRLLLKPLKKISRLLGGKNSEEVVGSPSLSELQSDTQE